MLLCVFSSVFFFFFVAREPHQANGRALGLPWGQARAPELSRGERKDDGKGEDTATRPEREAEGCQGMKTRGADRRSDSAKGGWISGEAQGLAYHIYICICFVL